MFPKLWMHTSRKPLTKQGEIMIYSNFPATLETKYSPNQAPRIILGDESLVKNFFMIFSHAQQTIEPGMNPYLNFEFNRGATLTLKNFFGDWRNFDDPNWNVPGQLFLLLTADIGLGKKQYVKNGAIHTFQGDDRPQFKLYMRINHLVNRKFISPIAIYKVITDEPSVVRITPPTQAPKTYLYIHDGNIREYTETTPDFRKKAKEVYDDFSNKFKKLEWLPL